jgi:hypothetical protein
MVRIQTRLLEDCGGWCRWTWDERQGEKERGDQVKGGGTRCVAPVETLAEAAQRAGRATRALL